MQLLTTTLGQMFVLFDLIFIGFFLAKIKIMENGSATILSRLENNLLLPALVMSTFVENFTVKTIESAWKILLVSTGIGIVMILLAIFVSRCCSKDKFIQNIFTYGLSFSNFGFMGNAVVKAVFPNIFMEYLIFTLPLWTIIYLWAVPTLLIPAEGGKQTLKARMKSFLNPMFGGMLVGMVIGLAGIPMPAPVTNLLKVTGDCMSPIAMILTGITVANMDFKKIMSMVNIYVISIVRLVVFPLLGIGAFYLLKFTSITVSETIVVCTIASLAMPLGLSPIIIPSAYGKDTSVAAGATLASHALSCLTIPVMFYLLQCIL